MTKDQAIDFIRVIVKAGIALDQDKISEARTLLETSEMSLMALHHLTDDDLIGKGIPVCICDDGRGWSTCGAKCLYHPPDYICICGGCGNCNLVGEDRACKRRVAYMKLCVKCDPKS